MIYFLPLERVPITGRRRLSWLSQLALEKMDETERQVMEVLRQNEEKLFIKQDYPGLRKIEDILKRVGEASGLDDIAWEVRVADEPSMSFSRIFFLYSSAGRRLCPRIMAPIDYRVDFIPDVAYATTFNSGLVIISTGYFHHVIKNDDELATVLGNAVAHVLARHILEQVRIALADKYVTQPLAWLALLATIDARGIVFPIPFTVSWLAKFGLSRVREREADYIGLLLMADAGFDPAGAISLWTKHDKWEKERNPHAQTGILPKLHEAWSTHPNVSVRRYLCVACVLVCVAILCSIGQ